MKIVIFGLTISSSWGNGHATLWRGLCKALAKRGHHIVFFEHDVPYYRAHRDQWELAEGNLVLYSSWDAVRSNAEAELRDCDVALVTSYCPDAIEASELVLSSGAPRRVFYDLDSPITLHECRNGRSPSYIGPRGLADFDLVLSYAGGKALQDLEQCLGARRAIPIYGSVDPAVHRPAQPRTEFAADLSYLGTYAQDRQQALDELFVSAARRQPARRFLIGGAQYPDAFPWCDNIFFVHHVPPTDHSAFFCSSRLTLNVTREAMARIGYCPSGRLFEAAAAGAPILSDWWEGLDQFFAPDGEILTGRTTDDAVAALERSDDELARMARRARERTLDEHTADRRALDFEAALESVATAPTTSPSAAEPETSLSGR